MLFGELFYLCALLQGLLAQLVQSACFTRMRSLVRILHSPRKGDVEKQRFETSPFSFFLIADGSGRFIPEYEFLPEVRFVGHVAGQGGMVSKNGIFHNRLA